VAAIGYAAALTPALLPYPLPFLLLLTSLGTVSGYAIGATAGWALRKIPRLRDWSAPRWSVWTMWAALWLPALAFTPVAIGWQVEQQEELGMPATLPSTLVIVVATAVIATLLLLLGRSIRLGSNTLARLAHRGPIARWSIRWTRLATAVVLVLVANAVLGLGMNRLVASYDTINADTSGQSATDLGINSGSPDSLTPWETLGRQGRAYVGNTMTPEEISAITGEPAETPVRVYVGMEQADTPDARTALAVQELDRVDAWSREYLVIFGVTGTGWVDPNAINALETVTDGDVTTVAVQYSAVPSWIGFVIDPQTTIDQNRSMIDGDEVKAAPTIVFVAHANDPVVYWSPSLLLSKPDWMEPPLGPGVMPQMRWFPIVSFLQVGMGLISGGEPPEVGHNYSANMAQAIALAVSPEGWTVEKTRALNAALPSLLYPTG
jgi:uncharacterized membrane protein